MNEIIYSTTCVAILVIVAAVFYMNRIITTVTGRLIVILTVSAAIAFFPLKNVMFLSAFISMILFAYE
jgi:hypothetical protein